MVPVGSSISLVIASSQTCPNISDGGSIILFELVIFTKIQIDSLFHFL